MHREGKDGGIAGLEFLDSALLVVSLELAWPVPPTKGEAGQCLVVLESRPRLLGKLDRAHKAEREIGNQATNFRESICHRQE